MPITDLTGYTWVGNESLYTPTGSDASYEMYYALNYRSSNHNFTSLNMYGENVASMKSISVEYAGTSYKSIFDGELLSEMSIWYDENGNETTYALTPWKEIHISGGDDVTNANVIAWLEANGTLTPPAQNITLDLSTIGLPVGSHVIQMKLSDNGLTKADSELSNSVTYVEPEPAGFNVKIQLGDYEDNNNRFYYSLDNGITYTLINDSDDVELLNVSQIKFKYYVENDTDCVNVYLKTISGTIITGDIPSTSSSFTGELTLYSDNITLTEDSVYEISGRLD